MRRSVYSGGYSDAMRRQLDSVTMPSKIKCDTCKKIRMQSAFSKRQLDAIRNAIVLRGPNVATSTGHGAKCRICVGGQTVELKCCMCNKIKGLEEFSKSQRQYRDDARCLNCVQSHAEADPVLEEHKLLTEGELSTAQDTNMTASQIDDGSLVTPSKKFRQDVSYHYSHDGFDDDEDMSVGGGVWVEASENTTTQGRSLAFTGFDPQGRAHQRSTLVPGPESVHSGWASLGVTPRTAAPEPPKRKVSNFAKIPGRRFEKSEAPSMRVPEPTGQTIASDDEEEDDGVEDFL